MKAFDGHRPQPPTPLPSQTGILPKVSPQLSRDPVLRKWLLEVSHLGAKASLVLDSGRTVTAAS